MNQLIGFVGFKEAGKSTIGSIMENEYGFSCDSFAAPLKDAVAAIFSWDRKMLEGDTVESREWREKPDEFWSRTIPGFTPRIALQKLGTECCRDVFSDDVWIRSLFKRIEGKPNVVITDVRFKNEIRSIRDKGGLIFRIKRGDDDAWVEAVARGDVVDEALLPHRSERDWIGEEIDGVIENDGTIDELRSKIRRTVLSPR